eukprot:gene7014-7799_t
MSAMGREETDNNISFAANKKCFLFMKIMESSPSILFNRDNIGIEHKKFDILQLVCCPSCERLIHHCVTLNCGCTFCSRCYKNEDSKNNCRTCFKDREKKLMPSDRSHNHVLNNIITRFCKQEIRSMKTLFQGRVAQEKQKFLEARETFENALQLCPGNYLAWLYQAELLLEMNLKEEALFAANQAILCKKNYEKAYIIKTNILMALDRLADAVVVLLQLFIVDFFNKEAEDLLDQVFYKLLNERRKEETEDKKCENVDVNEIIRVITEHFIKEIQNTNDKRNETEIDKSPFSPNDFEELSFELECTLCRAIFFEPVTTMCGHVFCKDCLTRWFDFNRGCPVCRGSSFQHVNISKWEVTSLLDDFVTAFYSNEIKERSEARFAERQNLARVAFDTDADIPIFVCCIALPSRPIQLQIFEPHYRLMLRQCLQAGTKQFGMCASDQQRGFKEYGIMLEVNDVIFFPDGRAFIDCLGRRRFKVLSSGERDGYKVGKVEWIRDEVVPPEKIDEIEHLNMKVNEQVKSFLEDIYNRREERESLDGNFLVCDWSYKLEDIGSKILIGWPSDAIELPANDNDEIKERNGPDWVWWVVDNFVYSTEMKLRLLSCTSLEQRLNLIQGHLIEMIN